MKLTRVRYFDETRRFSYGDVTAENGRIVSVDRREEAPPDSADFLIPGLIDLHLHGCAGADFCDGKPDSLFQMARFLKEQGVTSFCPATMSLPEEALRAACESAARFASESDSDCAVLRGVTLEGPFLSPEKCGAQDARFLCAPSLPLLSRLQTAANGLIRTVCVAPELPGAVPFIERAAKETTVSLAHTACSYEQAAAAFDAGASSVTHLFNAMGAFGHRAPGVLGAAAERANATVELIADGVHVHPSAVRLAFRLFGGERVCLISDSMAACGLEDGQYALGGQAVFVRGGNASLADGTIAGSVKCLFDVLQAAIGMGLPPEAAVTAAAFTPAKRLGLTQALGCVAPGLRADLILCSSQWERKEVWLQGAPCL